jgi:hypothetical protein
VHKHETGYATSIGKAQYKTAFAFRHELNRQVQKIIDKGVISPSQYPWLSPSVIMPKRTNNDFRITGLASCFRH